MSSYLKQQITLNEYLSENWHLFSGEIQQGLIELAYKILKDPRISLLEDSADSLIDTILDASERTDPRYQRNLREALKGTLPRETKADTP